MAVAVEEEEIESSCGGHIGVRSNFKSIGGDLGGNGCQLHLSIAIVIVVQQQQLNSQLMQSFCHV